MELIEIVARIIEREPLSGTIIVILILQFIYARNQERDDRNTSNAIALASAVVTTFEPLRLILEKMVTLVPDKHAETQALIAGAAKEAQLAHQIHLERLDTARETMQVVSERRDEQHTTTLTHFNRLYEQVEQLTQSIKVGAMVASIPPEIRQDITKLVLLTTEISMGVRQLIPKSEPGESKDPAQEQQETEI